MKTTEVVNEVVEVAEAVKPAGFSMQSMTTGEKVLGGAILAAAGYGVFTAGRKIANGVKNFINKRKAEKQATETVTEE